LDRYRAVVAVSFAALAISYGIVGSYMLVLLAAITASTVRPFQWPTDAYVSHQKPRKIPARAARQSPRSALQPRESPYRAAPAQAPARNDGARAQGRARRAASPA
jgi:hypothetical protein